MINYKKQPCHRILLLSLTLCISLASCDPGGKGTTGKGERSKADVKKEMEALIHSLTAEELEAGLKIYIADLQQNQVIQQEAIQAAIESKSQGALASKQPFLDYCNQSLSEIDQGAKSENKQHWGERIKKLSEDLNNAERRRNTLANNLSATPAQKSFAEKAIKLCQLYLAYAKLARPAAGK